MKWIKNLINKIKMKIQAKKKLKAIEKKDFTNCWSDKHEMD